MEKGRKIVKEIRPKEWGPFGGETRYIEMEIKEYNIQMNVWKNEAQNLCFDSITEVIEFLKTENQAGDVDWWVSQIFTNGSVYEIGNYISGINFLEKRKEWEEKNSY